MHYRIYSFFCFNSISISIVPLNMYFYLLFYNFQILLRKNFDFSKKFFKSSPIFGFGLYLLIILF